jgi:hypothetical protein
MDFKTAEQQVDRLLTVCFRISIRRAASPNEHAVSRRPLRESVGDSKDVT